LNSFASSKVSDFVFDWITKVSKNLSLFFFSLKKFPSPISLKLRINFKQLNRKLPNLEGSKDLLLLKKIVFFCQIRFRESFQTKIHKKLFFYIFPKKKSPKFTKENQEEE